MDISRNEKVRDGRSERQQNEMKLKNRLTILGLVVYDVAVTYFSYLAALYLRFYVNHKFHVAAVKYLPAFYKIAPFYVICCIVVFSFCGLYSGVWKYAGFNDGHRILLAGVITCLIQIIGSLVFVMRMPMTYYALGALIQLLLIFASRFFPRLVSGEISRIAKSTNESFVNVMVIGAGESARIIINQLDSDQTNIARPICVVDYRGTTVGKTFNGLPVLRGTNGKNAVREAVQKHDIQIAIIADSLMSIDSRKEIRSLCREIGIDVQDFSGYMQSSLRGTTLLSLLECVEGSVTVIYGELCRSFQNAEEAALALPGKYIVKSVKALKDELIIEIEASAAGLTQGNEDWIQEYETRTGEKVSFF